MNEDPLWLRRLNTLIIVLINLVLWGVLAIGISELWRTFK